MGVNTYPSTALQWRYNECEGVSNHRRLVYSIVCSSADQRKTSKLCVTGLCEGNSPVTGEFTSQRASNTENAFIWWRHHGIILIYTLAASRAAIYWNETMIILTKHSLLVAMNVIKMTFQAVTQISLKWHFHFSVSWVFREIFVTFQKVQCTALYHTVFQVYGAVSRSVTHVVPWKWRVFNITSLI